MNARTWVTAVLGLGFAIVLVGQAVAIRVSWGGFYWLFDFASGGVVCVLALAHGRRPIALAAASLAVAAGAAVVALVAGLPREPGPAMLLALAVQVGSIVRRLPARPAAALATGGFALAASGLLDSQTPNARGVAILGIAMWLAAVAIGLSLRLLALRRRAAAEQIRRDERLALARELHDVAAHHITGIVVQAHAAQIVARRQPEQLDTALTAIADAGSDALTAMRRIVGLLREGDDAAPMTSAVTGPEALEDLVERFRGQGYRVKLRLPDVGPLEWPPEVASTVYRVVQESLTNIARHAVQAKTVTVSVSQQEEDITVEVVDDAPGAPVRPHRVGYGLAGMRERIEALGGTLRAGPRPGAGWSVVATLPGRERR